MKQTVLLVDYGGPEKIADIEPYLMRLFNDPHILSVPVFVRRFLAAWIAKKRLPKAIQIYEQLGGASPVNATVKTLCEKLNSVQEEFAFEPAFLLQPPFLIDALNSHPSALICPLFPQEAFATWGMIREKRKAFKRSTCVVPYFAHPDFIRMLVARLEAQLALSSTPKSTFILCTAHAIPMQHVRKGDQYVAQLIQQVEQIQKQFPAIPVKLGYQSRLGPVRWTEPRLESVLAWAQTEGYHTAIVLPLSFTIDNSETLVELDQHYATIAQAYGITRWERVACLNADRDFQRFILKVLAEFQNSFDS